MIVDGVDRPDWVRIGAMVSPDSRPASTVDVQLVSDGAHIAATVVPTANAPRKLAAYWAVTEQRHVSAVKAGENEGATLTHDHVVRDYRPVPAWQPPMSGASKTLQIDVPGGADPAHPRTVNFVVVDAVTGRPVQAVRLSC